MKSLVKVASLLVCSAGCVAVSVAQEPTPADMDPAVEVRLRGVLANDDATAFVDGMVRFWDEDRHALAEATKADARRQLSERSKRYILQGDALPSLDDERLQTLVGFAAESLAPSERAQILQRINASFPSSPRASFDALQRRIVLLNALTGGDGGRRDERRAEILAWLNAQTVATVPESQLNWCFRQTCRRVPDHDGFEITWSGTLRAPRSGDYVFSIPPSNQCEEYFEGGAEKYHRQWFSITLDGTAVIDATPETWTAESQPVSLQAGQPVRIEATFKYARNETHKPCAAVLLWEGPGVSRSVVPARAFSNDGDGEGLAVVYRWRVLHADDGERIEEVVETRTADNIEHMWNRGLVIGPRGARLRGLVSAYANRWTANADEFAGAIRRRPEMIGLLDCDSLQNCLRNLAQAPETLTSLSSSAMLQIFQAVHNGCEEDAVDVLGAWMQLRADAAPAIASSARDYFTLNHKFYWNLAGIVGFEHPPSLQWLRERYLDTPDGGCCLPVAYLLAQVSVLRSSPEARFGEETEIVEWIGVLRDKLAEKDLVGDQRASWLLGYAVAMDLSTGRPGRQAWNFPVLAYGIDAVTEASLVAESDAWLDRVRLEIVARKAACGQLDEAESQLAETSQAGDMAGTAKEYQAAVTTFRAEQEARKESRHERHQQAHQRTLVRLIDRARSKGQSALAERLQGELDAAK